MYYPFSSKKILELDLQVRGNLEWHTLLTSFSVIHPSETSEILKPNLTCEIKLKLTN